MVKITKHLPLLKSNESLGHCKSARRKDTKTRTNFKLTAITYCVKYTGNHE